ncbi:penicillin-binding protein 1C [Stella humosa]|uniref:peptidoglycan glycosyltransferase n=1 Tax=Stella humosa TaxID=94 RepID=A0A3N1L1B0_9PROT|nr:penicillin-binding protein 1C [Stella humosa]ROP84226.1 penicillin-binding protein 1C [Stella humosa]BBK33738.1 penicillin-binding protein 1C [Stella humosa]
MGRRWRRLAGAAVALAAGLAGLVAADRLLPPPLDRERQVSRMVLARDGEMLRAFTTPDGSWRLPAMPTDVDPLFLEMLLAYEDQRFRGHPGVDPLAVVRAAWQWVAAGEVVSGASTLTMQAARLLEPRPRTLRAKAAEALRALQLERRLDKDGILGLYLTLAPYGGNVEGVRAAARIYLGKEPTALRPAEAALLVALPQSPTRLRPDRFPEAARAARDKVLARMVERGVLDAAAAAEALEEPVPDRRFAMPFAAPHLAVALAGEAAAPRVIDTTIDLRLQREVEALAVREAARFDASQSMAAIVVDNRTRAVVAHVGSPDLFAPARDGAVDMTRRVRSPGSTLKPFIYALAFDELKLTPETLIDDRPTNFGGYAPSNFDHGFRGRVSAREALQLSLNVPAVAVLDRLGAERFAGRLAGLGVRLRTRDPHAVPSLPLALGGVGVTLTELAGLYAALAGDGSYVPPYVRPGERLPPVPFVGAQAAWSVTRILEEAPPPPGVAPAAIGQGRLVAIKTGTSYGYRDAWAFGWDAGYTVGVWTGRPDGTPLPGRWGLATAAPVLMKIFDLLPPPPMAPPRAVASATADNPASAVAGIRSIGSGRVGPAGPAPPVISFPPDGAVLPWRVGNGVPLVVEGGRPPLRWLVDGRPLAARDIGPRRPAEWLPDGRGFARLTVLDADGRGATATVRVE